MTKLWPWHLVGAMSAAAYVVLWLPAFLSHLPFPHMSAWWLVGWFLGSALLSIIAGYKASKWWFLVTACFGVTLVLLWIGEAVWEYGASPH